MTEGAFWDSSSLVPLCTIQSSTPSVLALSKQYSQIVWWTAPVEVRSAISRLARMGQITSNSQVQALVALDGLRRSWTEILPEDDIRDRAELMLDRYPLAAADALQLAAAWIWCDGHPRNRAFISGDTQLLAVASQAGFKAIQA